MPLKFVFGKLCCAYVASHMASRVYLVFFSVNRPGSGVPTYGKQFRMYHAQNGNQCVRGNIPAHISYGNVNYNTEERKNVMAR